MVDNKRMLLRSIAIATLIFLAGLAIGYGVDTLRSDDIIKFFENNELDAQAYAVEQEFLDVFGEPNCNVAKIRLGQLTSKLSEVGRYLTSYEASNIFRGKDYSFLSRRYFILEIKAYTLYKQLKENCEIDTPVILFFYDINDDGSQRQGYVLDILVKDHNASVFSVNREFDDPLLNTVRAHFGITKSPTIIVDYKIKLEGFVTKEEMLEVLSS